MVVGLALEDRTAPTIACNAPERLRWPRDRNVAITATAEEHCSVVTRVGFHQRGGRTTAIH